jgi:2-oxoglutarate dehydrogenase E1 component
MEPLPYHMNLAFSEEMLETYARDPAAVPPGWRAYLGNVSEEGAQAAVRRQPSFRPASIFHDHGLRRSNITAAEQIRIGARQDRVDQLIRAYRVRGHMLADLDPIGRPQREYPELDPEHYGFSEADMDQPFSSRTMGGPAVRTLRQILQTLRDTYCRHIGVQFMHIDDLDVRHWLQESMEGTENRITLTHREQHRILRRLTEAVLFEEFIHKRFPGAKSFSLEGAESLIPLLDLSIEKAGEQGVREIVIGMAHRGRLNVLANIAGKSPTSIFREFEDMDAERYVGRGDVKYHLGEHTNWVTASEKSVHVALRFNPSHLEFGNPVVLGRVRAKQDRLGDENREQVIALLIHGDAAFAGEGVVQESLNLSELEAYRIGGTVHVIVNNQLGFTTSPKEGRSTPYASDVAKMLQSPIFHVNGEDPEAVAQVVRLASVHAAADVCSDRETQDDP